MFRVTPEEVKTKCLSKGRVTRYGYPENGDIVIMRGEQRVWFKGGTFNKEFEWTEQLIMEYSILEDK